MSKLTGTHSEAASYEFTTLTTVPGTIAVHGCPIQILDLRAYLLVVLLYQTAADQILERCLPLTAGIIEGAKVRCRSLLWSLCL